VAGFVVDADGIASRSFAHRASPPLSPDWRSIAAVSDGE
jgi:hypothetical protein